MRKAVYRAAVTLGADRLLRSRRAGGIVLCYHGVIAAGDVPPGDSALHLPLRDFKSQLDFLSRHFAVIPLAELDARMRAGRSLRGTAVITFDDGYRGVLQHAIPALRARALPASLFITSVGATTGSTYWWDWPQPGAEAADPALRPLLLDRCRGDSARIAEALGVAPVPATGPFRPASWAELRDAAGPDITFGVHTASHLNLAALGDEAMRRELRENADDIARELGARPSAVAYPFGSWTPAVARAAADVGLRLGLTLDSHDVLPTTPSLSIPRVNIPASISADAFRLWVSGLAALRAN